MLFEMKQQMKQQLLLPDKLILLEEEKLTLIYHKSAAQEVKHEDETLDIFWGVRHIQLLEYSKTSPSP